jgi:hypothetical protein
MTKMHKHWVLRSLGVIGLAVIGAAGLLVGSALSVSTGLSSSNTKAVRGSSWSSTATQLRGFNGRVFTFRCPRNGVAHFVWGTGTYADDSSVCTAAVHAGFITRARGGVVKIRIRPGRSRYKGTTRYGITSHRWGRWHGSFVVVSATALPKPPTTSTSTTTKTTTTTATTSTTTTTTSTTTNTTTTTSTPDYAAWSATATSHRGENGSVFTFSCPAPGVAYPVWGSGTYSDDSSVCTAAVHAGRITLTGGGRVSIMIARAENSYTGTTKNGITSRPWGYWYGSYVFV